MADDTQIIHSAKPAPPLNGASSIHETETAIGHAPSLLRLLISFQSAVCIPIPAGHRVHRPVFRGGFEELVEAVKSVRQD